MTDETKASAVVTTGVFGKRSGVAVSNDSLMANMNKSAGNDPRGGSGDTNSVFMNYSGKLGRYQIGRDKRNTDKEELWVVAIPSFEDGYICWKEGKPYATRLFPMGQEIPHQDMDEGGPFPRDGDGWFQAKAVTVRSLDTGEQAYFKINSVSGVSAIADLQREVVARLAAGLPCWPVVSFDTETFEARGYKNSKPVIAIDGWLNDASVNDLAAVFDDPDAEIDLPAMYAAAALPGSGEQVESNEDGDAEVEQAPPAAEKVTRRRRAAL